MLATSASGGVDGQLFVGTTKNIVIEGSLQQKFTSIIQVINKNKKKQNLRNAEQSKVTALSDSVKNC